MMKVSDPIMFGNMVRVFYKDVFSKYSDLFSSLGVNPNNGLGDVYDKIKGNPKQAEVEAAFMECYQARPGLAMVDSSKGQNTQSSLCQMKANLSRNHEPPCAE